MPRNEAGHAFARVCGAKNRQGGECGRPAGWGTGTPWGKCKHHGGASPSGRKFAKAEELRHAAATLGLPRDVDPAEALTEELRAQSGLVTWLRDLLASTPTTEVSAVWLGVYADERDRLLRVAKTCADAGVEERQVRVAERTGDLLAGAVGGILADLGVSGHPDAPAVVRRHLLALGSGPSS